MQDKENEDISQQIENEKPKKEKKRMLNFPRMQYYK